MTTRVSAYGTMHTATTYEQAVAMARAAKEVGVTITLARIENDTFELLSLEDEYRVDSEYVTVEVGRRLYSEGHYGVMVLWGNPNEEPTTPEEWKAREHEQIYGAYAP